MERCSIGSQNRSIYATLSVTYILLMDNTLHDAMYMDPKKVELSTPDVLVCRPPLGRKNMGCIGSYDG